MRSSNGGANGACGRAELPTAAVIDAQTVRGADTVAADGAGYDWAKAVLCLTLTTS